MNLERAQESLQAANLCLQAGYVNSAASRAYYAMFQAAQAALEAAGFTRAFWGHAVLQATFTAVLITRRKVYPSGLSAIISPRGLRARHRADYGASGTSQKVAQRMQRRATTFVAVIEEVLHR